MRLTSSVTRFVRFVIVGSVICAVAPSRSSAEDCNVNGIDDACDIDCGAPGGPYDLPGCGGCLDCNDNGIPDECDIDAGSIPDEAIKLTASDAAARDRFGHSVSISGDTAVIGADGDDDAGTQSGSAYVFRYDGIGWVQQAKLTASDGAARDYFGTAVSISGDTAVIGAERDDDAGTHSGSAYVFVGVSGIDCNNNGVPDECELAGNDCNVNGIPDECDPDADGDGQIDTCKLSGDFDDDGDVDLGDLLAFKACLSDPGAPRAVDCEEADFDDDGDTDLANLVAFQAAFTGPR